MSSRKTTTKKTASKAATSKKPATSRKPAASTKKAPAKKTTASRKPATKKTAASKKPAPKKNVNSAAKKAPAKKRTKKKVAAKTQKPVVVIPAGAAALPNNAIKKLSWKAGVNRLSSEARDYVLGVMTQDLKEFTKLLVVATKGNDATKVSEEIVQMVLSHVGHPWGGGFKKGKTGYAVHTVKGKRTKTKMQNLQKDAESLVIARAPFQKAVRSQAKQHLAESNYEGNLFFVANALDIIQFLFEARYVSILEHAAKVRDAGGKDTLLAPHVQVAYEATPKLKVYL